MTLNSDFQKLYVDGLITLFELDARTLGAGILRFHGHISYEDWERIYTSIGSSELIGADTGSIGKTFDSGTEKTWHRNIIWGWSIVMLCSKIWLRKGKIFGNT